MVILLKTISNLDNASFYAGRLRSSNILPEESCVKNVVDNCSKTSTEVSRLVYSRRRKKVKAITRIKGKYNCPLSESIICSNVEDNHVSETCPSRNPIALETVEMGSSDEKSHTKDLSRVEPKVLGQSQNLHAERSTVNMISAVSQHQSFTSASKSKETIYFLDRSGSHVQKSHIHVDKELVGPKNLFLPSSFESSEELRIGISNRSPPTVKEYGCSSDGKPKNMATNKDLLGLGELVGCYLHPLPVLSLLVCTTGEDIHICVLCGLRVNKDRTLFIYKIATQEPRVGYPSFVGHTSVTLPTLKDYFGKEVSYHLHICRLVCFY